jgi:hypothetical protein
MASSWGLAGVAGRDELFVDKAAELLARLLGLDDARAAVGVWRFLEPSACSAIPRSISEISLHV